MHGILVGLSLARRQHSTIPRHTVMPSVGHYMPFLDVGAVPTAAAARNPNPVEHGRKQEQIAATNSTGATQVEETGCTSSSAGQSGAGSTLSMAEEESGGLSAGQTGAVDVACPGDGADPPEAGGPEPLQPEAEGVDDDDRRYQLEHRRDHRAEATPLP